MSENLRRAQLLADKAFELLMWNPNGDGRTWEPKRSNATDRDTRAAQDMTALSQAYSMIARHETGEGGYDETSITLAQNDPDNPHPAGW